MLIEQAAYNNHWRSVSPAAKGIFAACGFIATFAAGTPPRAALIAGLLAAASLFGAGIRPGTYLRVAAPALFFLSLACVSLAFSLVVDKGSPVVQLAPASLARIPEVGARSLGALAALLFLVMTTPLTDLISLLRRLKAPELLLDIMTLCYRMLFVFSAAVHDTLTAQSARLGYATPRLAMRSLGGMAANLTLQVWQRAQSLQRAAQARNNDGPLHFLEPVFARPARHCTMAGLAGSSLILLAVVPT